MTLWSNRISASRDRRRCFRRVLFSFTKALSVDLQILVHYFLRRAVKRPHSEQNSFHIGLRCRETASSLARWHFMITVLLVCVQLHVHVTDRFGRMIKTLFSNFENIRNQYTCTSVNSILKLKHNQWNSVEKNYFHHIILKLPLIRLVK